MAAYMLAQLKVHDPDGFARYREKVAPLVEQFGGRYLVRGGELTPVEGEPPAPRIVVIEFADRDSDAYQEILPLRLNSADGTAVIVEGI